MVEYDEGGDFEEREMSCGWCKIELSDVGELVSAKVFNQQMKGGSPFSSVKIKSEDISARRHGWRKFLQNFTGAGDIESRISFKVTPFSKLGAHKQEHIALLPSCIICAMSWVPLIRVFREHVAQMLWSDSDGPQRNHSPNQTGAFSEPVLAMFPKVVSDPAMITALTAKWYEQKVAMKQAGGVMPGSSDWRDTDKLRKAFNFVMHRLWLASCAKATQLPVGRIGETYDQTMARANCIKNIVFNNSGDVLKELEDGGGEEHLFTPFNTREVTFQFRT